MKRMKRNLQICALTNCLAGNSSKLRFHGKIAKIFENLNRFGTPFQKVFCHSANSDTPWQNTFQALKPLPIIPLLPAHGVFCHSANPQRNPKKNNGKWGSLPKMTD
jgi:hypothetical protein